ncbi:hypothetical protein ABNR98_004426 [Salmonella enterica]
MRIRSSNKTTSIQIKPDRRDALDRYIVQLSLKAGKPLYITDVINSLIDCIDKLDEGIILEQFSLNNKKAIQKKNRQKMERQKLTGD